MGVEKSPRRKRRDRRRYERGKRAQTWGGPITHTHADGSVTNEQPNNWKADRPRKRTSQELDE